jgi:Zn-dependent protease
MNKGLRIARLFGIDIRIDWSWLLILLLVVWNLTTAFSQFHPDWSMPLTIFLGLIAALLFFASVLLHELAHSLVAKSSGITVNNITLYLFGGAANIKEEPKSPRSEFIMAILGPLTSIIIGVVLLFISGIGTEIQNVENLQPNDIFQSFSAVKTLTVWLGSVNVFLGVFNLIPGFPLDGGRILRSIFWAISDDLRKATRWASYFGHGVAWLLITSGIAMTFGLRIPLLGEGLVSGVWLILIGWFLNNAASRSYQQLVIRDILEDVPVSKMTKRNPPIVPAGLSIEALIEDYIMQTDDHAFPVMEHDQLVGIVCLDDVRRIPRSERSNKLVSDIMTPKAKLITLSPEDSAHEALTSISQNAIRQIVVMDGDEFYGLVRRRDIVRFLQIQSDEFNLKGQIERTNHETNNE